MPLLAGIILALALGLFLLIQTRTQILDRSYPIAVLLLFLLLASAVWFTISATHTPIVGLRLVFVLAGAILTALAGILLGLKLRMRDTWTASAHKLLRTPTRLDFPHDRFTVTTDDGVTIKGYHVHPVPDRKRRDSVVILAHGGLRSKDLFVKALMAAWLAESFDVVAFDFRGHGESGGYWTGDGKSVADLEAVVKYVRELGYRKVGVYGRSMGGWTAVLHAADCHDPAREAGTRHAVDAIAIAGIPPGFYTEVPEFQGRLHYLKYPGAALLIRILTGMRIRAFPNVRSAIAEIDQVSPIPLLVIFNQVDPGAGVAGEVGLWESLSRDQRPPDYRRVNTLPYTADEVFDRAAEPKFKVVLPGISHVYSLVAMRPLLLSVEQFFISHLGERGQAQSVEPSEVLHYA